MRLDFGLVSPWGRIIGLPLGASNQGIQLATGVPRRCRSINPRGRVNTECRDPVLDCIAFEPHKTVELKTWDSSLPSPGIESRGFDVQLVG
jgi:hypothetical protein